MRVSFFGYKFSNIFISYVVEAYENIAPLDLAP